MDVSSAPLLGLHQHNYGTKSDAGYNNVKPANTSISLKLDRRGTGTATRCAKNERGRSARSIGNERNEGRFAEVLIYERWRAVCETRLRVGEGIDLGMR